MAGIFDSLATDDPQWISSSEENAKRAELAATSAINSQSSAAADADQAKHYMELAAGAVSGVALFNERHGAVYPQKGDYTADMVGARSVTWSPGWNDITSKPDVAVKTTAQTITGLFSFNATTPNEGVGLAFGANGSELRMNNLTTDLEIMHGNSKAILGLQEDGVIFAKTSTGMKYRYYTEANPFPIASNYKLQTLAGADSIKIDASTASVFHITLDRASTNLTFAPYGGESAFRQITLLVLQDVFGDRAINWPANVKWSQDRKPQLSLDANIMDVLTLASYDSGNTWLGFFNGGWFNMN
ncbi:TPA: hypothetical protein ACYFBF_003351 [Klebsiella pneumoniae]|uniref:hypothetical protein n=1 Tax=Klebsiella pneumoniae TaxID=573 RepID=UPI000B9ADAD5|nr:hypothetical protein [Klebsiella pneumoniae]AWA69295.1 hypothetical protein B7D49_19840 [Klebsiella pneumoniae]MCB3011212.1 hypothetical protein [Klebsiella pneumoniae]MCB3212090.1 hypothetical protein [Klebsiella pneumoniae]MCB3223824.1 hypothetical protein [Klebsiella pneumoniae]MCB3226917.1 hypothetical protein [Klebsiella pneumoniae]